MSEHLRRRNGESHGSIVDPRCHRKSVATITATGNLPRMTCRSRSTDHSGGGFAAGPLQSLGRGGCHWQRPRRRLRRDSGLEGPVLLDPA